MAFILTLTDGAPVETPLSLFAGERLDIELSGPALGAAQWLTVATSAGAAALVAVRGSAGAISLAPEALAPLAAGVAHVYNLWSEEAGALRLRAHGRFLRRASIPPDLMAGGTLLTYWGAADSPTPTAEAVLALPGAGPATARARSVSIDATGGRYPVLAYPAALGLPAEVRAYGFVTDVTVSPLVLPIGAGQDYLVLALAQPQDGIVPVEVL